jgi:hypothetical protein
MPYRTARRIPVIALSTMAMAMGSVLGFAASSGSAASPAPIPTQTFTWTGTASAAGVSKDWSDGANWQGGVAPSGQAVDLVFPALQCVHGKRCGNRSVNDLKGFTVDRLTLDTAAVKADAAPPPNYVLSGDTLTVRTGLEATGAPSTVEPFNPVIVFPLHLVGSQKWTFDRTTMWLDGAISGRGTLTANLQRSGLLFNAGATLGGLDIVGNDTAETGNAAPTNGGVTSPSGLPLTVKGALTITDVDTDFMGSAGSITTSGALLSVGGSSPPNEGIWSSTGNVTFDSKSVLQLSALFPPAQPGTNYPQITAAGSVALGNMAIVISAGCAQRKGIVYTLIKARGGVSGLLDQPSTGGTTPIPQGGLVETQQSDNEGTCEGPPSQWVRINYNDSAGTVTATTVTRPT